MLTFYGKFYVYVVRIEASFRGSLYTLAIMWRVRHVVRTLDERTSVVAEWLHNGRNLAVE